MLEIGEGDASHERMSVQTGPGSTLKAVEAEFLLQLLMPLLAHPARLDRRCQASQRGADWKIAEIVFAFPAVAQFSDEPDFLTG